LLCRYVRVGSKSEKLHASICFPLFTQQRTSPRYFGMSVSCQTRTYALAIIDHLVGGCQAQLIANQRRWGTMWT
jgi:hypothetical protein